MTLHAIGSCGVAVALGEGFEGAAALGSRVRLSVPTGAVFGVAEGRGVRVGVGVDVGDGRGVADCKTACET